MTTGAAAAPPTSDGSLTHRQILTILAGLLGRFTDAYEALGTEWVDDRVAHRGSRTGGTN
jgi:hypothetical protein